MPNFSGIWTTTQQFQARGQNLWPAAPGAPTIGTATAGTSNCASVAFTAPACTGRFPAGISGYTAVSTPGCVTASGASSPVTVTGLTTGTSYTFRVRATGANGLAGSLSSASNSITATVATSAAYTTPGTYSWVAPAGVTSVAVVAVGGGGSGRGSYFCPCNNVFTGGSGGSGGGLGYINNYLVTPGSSYTVVVGSGGLGVANGSSNGGTSHFVSTSVVRGGGGFGGPCNRSYVSQGDYAGNGGGFGGRNGYAGISNGAGGGGGGAGGYSGNGGNGGVPGGGGGCGFPPTAGSGGGGGGGRTKTGTPALESGGGGGGVGIFGQGANGTNLGGGGSGGTGGVYSPATSAGGAGGLYGGAGGGVRPVGSVAGGNGAGGAVRIVWCVSGLRGTPSFPSTNVGAP